MDVPRLRTAATLARRSVGIRTHGDEIAALLHGPSSRVAAEDALHGLLRGLLESGTAEGDVRSDVPADELASFCLRALDAVRDVRSDTAAGRVVDLVLGAVRPPREG